ncbi:trypsin-like serine peptidase [Nocardioides humilatus]|nr:trypsin-like serine protease [Nocardioides humilatus]
MSDQQPSSLRQKLLPLAAAVLTLGAIVGFSQLSANVTSGAGAKPTHRQSVPLAGPTGPTVVTNSNPDATKAYWTTAKLQRAKEISLVRTDAVDMSYGAANLDFTRSRITPQTANVAAPYRSVGKIFFTQPGVGDFQCSGSIIAKRIVITAAHCVNSGHGFFTNWVFIPGYDGSKPTLATQRPLGTWAWSSAQVPSNWLTTDGALPNDTDFAAMVFADQDFGSGPLQLFKKAGKFVAVTNHLADTAVTMLGYPCNFDSCNIMQRVDTSDHRIPPGSSGSNAYEYGSDMTGGSSGGPWVENFGNPLSAAPSGGYATRNAVVAVTSYGYLDGGSALVLGASNLDSRWQDIFSARCAVAVGNC